MDHSRIVTILDWNADLWSSLTARVGNIPFAILIVVLLVYHFAVAVTLLCAVAGGSMVADRVAIDPELQDVAWTVPVMFFSIQLLKYTWIVATLGLFASSLLWAHWHIKHRQHPGVI